MSGWCCALAVAGVGTYHEGGGALVVLVGCGGGERPGDESAAVDALHAHPDQVPVQLLSQALFSVR